MRVAGIALNKDLENFQPDAVTQPKARICVLTTRNLAPTLSKPQLHGVDHVAVLWGNASEQRLLSVEEAVMMRVEAHRLAVENAICFIVHAMADLKKVKTGTNEEPIDVGL